MANAFHLQEKMQALTVGEPPSNRPNCYTENAFFQLPYSKIQLSVSTRFYQFQQDDNPEMKLDKRFERKFKAFQAGKDEVMEWIMNQ